MKKTILIIIFLMIVCVTQPFAADSFISNDPKAFSFLTVEEATFYSGAYFTGHFLSMAGIDSSAKDLSQVKLLETSAKSIGITLSPASKSIKTDAALEAALDKWRDQIYQGLRASAYPNEAGNYCFLGDAVQSIYNCAESSFEINPSKLMDPKLRENTLKVLKLAVLQVKAMGFPKDLQDTMIAMEENYSKAKTNREAYRAMQPQVLWSLKVIGTLTERIKQK
ncbi:MAG: hypothetical protein WCI57_05310 [Candidatus Berkelbacteria bacterium]